jgi:hypothetical protein
MGRQALTETGRHIARRPKLSQNCLAIPPSWYWQTRKHMMELAASQPRSRHDPFIAGQIMSPSHLFEPTYHAIKLRLMTGAWRAGFRLEPVKISAELGVGVSPIRDCLNRLTGERLIEAQSGEGFHVPLIQPQTLRELLDLNQTLLLTAILSSRPSMLAPLPPMSIMQHGLPASSITSDRRTTIWSFWSLSTTSATASTLRGIETSALPQAHSDLDALEAKLAISAPVHDIRKLIRHFHKRRRHAADRLVRSLPVI